MRYGIHWFRRDLRVAGNAALSENLIRSEGKVVGLFCFDRSFLSRNDFSHNRFQFFLESLRSLREDLRFLGGDLLFIDGTPHRNILELVLELGRSRCGRPSLFTWNRDYEPFARARDAEMHRLLAEADIPVHTEQDHLFFEPHEIVKPSDEKSGYQVYTPFSKRWRDLFYTMASHVRVEKELEAHRWEEEIVLRKSPKRFSLHWESLLDNRPKDRFDEVFSENLRYVTVPIPSAGAIAARQTLLIFKNRIEQYAADRDIPSRNATSNFSIFLKNGSLSIFRILAFFGLHQKAASKKVGADKFLSELIWREFYYHILFRHPQSETQSFLPEFRNLPWENHAEHFEAWKSGRTGFPIVDAGMRELNTTGRMHNRVRMIVASFLTKDLLVDWRLGEQYFMKHLLDGDLAPNNGGWQWAASTGCDPQPYFRIFNPTLQGTRFDPDGTYVRRFVPELSQLSSSEIHLPVNQVRNGYPAAIVDHAEQRTKAIAIFSKARETYLKNRKHD